MRIDALKYSYGIGRTETRGNAVLGCDFFGFVFGGCPDATEEDAGEGLAERAAKPAEAPPRMPLSTTPQGRWVRP